MGLRYLDIDSADLEAYPALRQAVQNGRPVPLVLVEDVVKSPPVLSFAWIVNEFRGLGVLE